MNWFRNKLVTYSAPVLTAGLLMGAAYFEREWPERASAEPYHAAAAKAVAAIPMHIGPWIGTEIPPQPAVIQVLRPNAIRNIQFIDPGPAALGRPSQKVALSVVQTQRAVDMLGHFPPNCYKGLGDEMTHVRLRQWFIRLPAGQTGAKNARTLFIPGTEYHFDRVINGKTHRRIVYNFMVAPKAGVLPDMNRLEEAAEDYEQRYFGAAQFQVVFGSLAGLELSEADRDEIFSTLMRECSDTIEVLKSGR
jgi:hypothetical protein